MKCENCKWLKRVSEIKKKFNKVWDFRSYDGYCMYEPNETPKYKDDFCSHFEEKNDYNDNNELCS